MSKKFFTTAMAAGVGLATALTGLGQFDNNLTVQQVLSGGANDVENIGPNARIDVSLPAGLDGTGVGVNNGEAISGVLLVGVDAAGMETANSVLLNVGAAVTAANYANALLPVQIDLDPAANPGLSAFFTNVIANDESVRMRIVTGAADVTMMGSQTAFNAAEAADTDFDPDNTPPNLTAVIIDSATMTAFFVFSESLNTGNAGANPGGNDANHTLEANVDQTDFQVDTSNNFDGTEASPTNLGAFTFLAGSDNTIFQATVNAGSTLTVGSFVRPFFDNVPSPQHQLFDIVANQAGNTAAQVAALAPLSITSVEAIAFADTTAAGVQAIRVRYNLPLDAADIGDAAFYGATLFRGTVDGTEAADFNIVGIAIDPDDSQSVLVSITAADNDAPADGINDTIFSDALDFDGNGYNITTSLAGNVPSSVFAADDYTTAQTVALIDRIAPFVLAGGNVFLDRDGACDLDASARVFSEPLATSDASQATFTLRKQSSTVQPFTLIDADGNLVNANVVADANPDNNVITVTTVETGSVAIAGQPDRLTANNAVIANFDPTGVDWNNDGTVGDDDEAIPGTGGDSAAGNIGAFTTEAAAGYNVTDAAGNTFNDVIAAAVGVNGDGAAPQCFAAEFNTGDNQLAGSPAQLLSEQDLLMPGGGAGGDGTPAGDLGDIVNNNRLHVITTEPMAVVNPNAVNESAVTISDGTNNLVFGDANAADGLSDLLFTAPAGQTNSFALGFENDPNVSGIAAPPATVPSTVLAPGATVSIVAGSMITDVAGNEIEIPGKEIIDGVAPYIAFNVDVNGIAVNGGFLVDDDGDNLVDRIILVATAPIDATTLDADDFTLSVGGVATVQLDGTDALSRTIEITPDSNIPISAQVTVTYAAGGQADARVASDVALGGNGVAVDEAQSAITVAQLAAPLVDTTNVAIQDVVGRVTLGGEPVPIGTKVFALVAIPTPRTIAGVHNNIPFTFTRNADISSEAPTIASINAVTNRLLGLASNLYFVRNDANLRQFANVPLSPAEGVDGDNTFGDALSVALNASNLEKITFQGTGEANTNRIQNGTVSLCWDVLRSANGTLAALYTGFGAAGAGYVAGGAPVLASAVIDNPDGDYALHVGAPATAFNGKSSFNAINWPIIIIVELPNGVRIAASSIASSVNGGPLTFQPTNLSQSDEDQIDAVSFDIELDNIGGEQIFTGWNTVAFGRQSGFALSSVSDDDLTNGVTADNIVEGTELPAVGAFDQFVYFGDANVPPDGMWTAADDAAARFDSIAIDFQCLASFGFVMDAEGVAAGAAVDRLTGGFAYGFFNGGGPLGSFQFGPALNETSPFTEFPNDNTTQGWGLFTLTGATDFNDLTGFDYAVLFNNTGAGIIVRSLDLQNPTGTQAPNDLEFEDIAAGADAIFLHALPQ